MSGAGRCAQRGHPEWSPTSPRFKRRVTSQRLSGVEHLKRDDWLYEPLRSESDRDDELRGWLIEADRGGQQRH
jgi:hypothetical protein